jgi:RNA polymerase sigma-70 factor (ECF subfamily)
VDREDVGKLYEAHFMRVFSYCMTLSGDRMLSEEITQETFFRAFMKRENYRGGSSEVTWLCTIARNIYIDEKRRSGRMDSLEDMTEEIADSSGGVEQTVADRDSSYRIHTALQELEEPYREVFELRVFGELGFREIGQKLGKTESWARVTYHRAKLKLQERTEV